MLEIHLKQMAFQEKAVDRQDRTSTLCMFASTFKFTPAVLHTKGMISIFSCRREVDLFSFDMNVNITVGHGDNTRKNQNLNETAQKHLVLRFFHLPAAQNHHRLDWFLSFPLNTHQTQSNLNHQ